MKNFIKIVEKFHKTKILIVGDLILDEFIWGDVDRISPEAPVPVVWAKKRTYMPGGAANVANNIRSLNGEVCLVGVAGEDDHAEILVSELRNRGISTEGVFFEPGRYTTVKTRIVAGHQQVVRLDWEHLEPLKKELNSKIIDFVKNNISKYDGIIIEDYGKGVINKDLVENLVSLALAKKKIITVDPKEEHFQYYRKFTSMTPNRKELENAVKNLKIKDTTNRFKINEYRLKADEDIDVAARQILEYLNLDSILVTLGEQGMRLFEKNRRVTHIPTFAQEVFDVSGAGDTVISTFTMGLCAGADKLSAAYISNVAAGIVVGKVGTAVITCNELIERISRESVKRDLRV